MYAKNCSICVIEPNKFESQIIADLLRGARVERLKVFNGTAEAALALEHFPADIVIVAFELDGVDGAEWTRAFRRNKRVANRKAAVFLTSHAFSRAIAEECRHAGANALIGKPVSGKALLATIEKVLKRPRAFVDSEFEGYVGPCRRAGIVTAGAAKRRRADKEAASEAEGDAVTEQTRAAVVKAAVQKAG